MLNITIIIQTIIIIFLIYLSLVFIIPFLTFPGFLFEIKAKKTNNFKKFASKFKAHKKEQTLRNVFKFIRSKYEKSDYKMYVLLQRHFYINVEKLLKLKGGYRPCHVQCLILKTLLINTGQFQEKDFHKKIIMTHWGTIHKLYLIEVGNSLFEVDPYFNIFKKLK